MTRRSLSATVDPFAARVDARDDTFALALDDATSTARARDADADDTIFARARTRAGDAESLWERHDDVGTEQFGNASSRAFRDIRRARAVGTRENVAMTTRRDERGSWAVTATDAEDERRGIERVGAREGIFSAREETRAEARARVEATLESFDERLARARARAEEARVDAERIERLLSESGRFRGGGQSDAATSRDEGRARRSTGAAISPERQSLHRPTPRWGLGASVDGTEWTTHRGPSRTFGEFGRGDRHSDVSVGSDEDGRSAFRAPRAVPVIRADRDIIPQGLSTPPRMRVRAEPPAPVRRRTRSVDLTTHPPFPSDLTQRVHTSVEIETSRVSTNSLLEAVANEAEFERLRRSSVEDDDQPVETKPRMP